MTRCTPLKCIRAQGGWTTAKLLLDVYGHFLPTEYDRARRSHLSASGALNTHPGHGAAGDIYGDGAVSHPLVAAISGYRSSSTGPRSPIMHLGRKSRERR